jgi:hypothetical protein
MIFIVVNQTPMQRFKTMWCAYFGRTIVGLWAGEVWPMGKMKLYVTIRSLKFLYSDQCGPQGITWNLSTNMMCFLKYGVFWYLNYVCSVIVYILDWLQCDTPAVKMQFISEREVDLNLLIHFTFITELQFVSLRS